MNKVKSMFVKDTSVPQAIPPSAIPPCELIMWTALRRPLAHSGMERCAATQSSEAAVVQATPAKPEAANNKTCCRATAITTAERPANPVRRCL